METKIMKISNRIDNYAYKILRLQNYLAESVISGTSISSGEMPPCWNVPS